MYKRVLVTGGAGFIGSHLALSLLKEGLEVVVLDNLSMGSKDNLHEGARFIQGDVRSPVDMKKSLDGVDGVFHLAARVSIRSSMASFYDDADNNLMGTLNLLHCCAGSHVRKIIYASSMAVYADAVSPDPIGEDYITEPLSPYGISKLAGEKYCLCFSKETGIVCHALRYFNTYGVGQTYTPYVGVITIFIRRLMEGKVPVIFGDGEQKRDFIHVSDVVAANMLSMKSTAPSGVFNVGTGEATSVNTIAGLLRNLINPDLAPAYEKAQPGELRYSIADISRASEMLSFSPKWKLHDKIEEVIKYHQQAGLPEVAAHGRSKPTVRFE